jgi:hypothetical protein
LSTPEERRSSTPEVYRRVVRRELHSPRSFAAILVAVLAIIALAWLGTECVLAAAGRPPLLMTPAQMATGITGLGSVASGTLVAAGVALALLGLVLLLVAFTPGRRPRHLIDDERAAIVVNNEVIASAIVREAARAGSVDPDRTVASVGNRTATVRITPTSGTDVDRAAIIRAVDDRLAGFHLSPALSTRVQVDRSGKVGA